LKRPEVTVVIPTRNRSDFLLRSMGTALAQEEIDIEVIVVDDGSTDDTASMLAAEPDERLRVIRLDERHGVARARNIGIAAARGDWLAPLDDDDLWVPRKLRWQLDAASDGNADFVYGGAVVFDDDYAVVRYGRQPAPGELCEALLVRNVIPGGCSNVIAKTELVRRLGGFDERLTQLADRDLWIRLAQAGAAAACAQVVVAYRLHAGNMRHRLGADGVAELEYLLEKHQADRRVVRASRRLGYHYFARAQLRAGNRLTAASIFTALAVRERRPADLGRALTSVLIGRSVRELAATLKRRLPSISTAEIEWLRGRTIEEIEWMRALTLHKIELTGERPKGAPTVLGEDGEALHQVDPLRAG
jgi:glycosyltransferase involved in cell wall biosynthesis